MSKPKKRKPEYLWMVEFKSRSGEWVTSICNINGPFTKKQAKAEVRRCSTHEYPYRSRRVAV